MNTNNQVPLWTQDESVAVLDSSAPAIKTSNGRVHGYDSAGVPREGVVLSKFVSEGKQFTTIKADDGNVYTIQQQILLG